MPKTREEIISRNRYCCCGKSATKQTAKGEYAEERNHHPVNYGYWCDKCFDEGLEIEKEAMYGRFGEDLP